MKSQLDRVRSTLGIRCLVTYGGEVPETFKGSNPWKVTLRFNRRSLTVPFYTGSAITKEPTAADVLSCLTSDARCGEESFEDFCSEFGYDIDSRSAEHTWKACRKTAPKLKRFLKDDFDFVASAEH